MKYSQFIEDLDALREKNFPGDTDIDIKFSHSLIYGWSINMAKKVADNVNVSITVIPGDRSMFSVVTTTTEERNV